MKYERKKSFGRIFRKLSSERQGKILEAIQSLIKFYETGIKPEGLGLKYLRDDVWEIRASLNDRILFSVEKDEILFLMAVI